MRFADCQCFAGGLAWSFVREGFELAAKREYSGGFGVPMMEGNRHLLGDRWETEACAPSSWTPKRVDVVAGNPPCSGFSLLNNSGKRGMDNKINQCMFDFVTFAAACKPATVVMESVQQAYTGGRPLMLKLREVLEQGTGKRYGVTHALHSVAALDGSQIRRRYFLVMSRKPFGIDERTVIRCRTGYSFISDLAERDMDWDGTPDGHTTSGMPRHDRLTRVAQAEPWAQGEKIGSVLDRIVARGGLKAVAELGYQPSSVISAVFDDVLGSAYAVTRVRENKLWPVLTGAGMSAVHPTKDRTLTYREAARLMGFPDEWSCKPCREDRKYGHAWFGKGVTTFAGRWIAGLVRDALDGRPHPVIGEEIGERERYVNVSNYFIKPNHLAQGGDDDEGE